MKLEFLYPAPNLSFTSYSNIIFYEQVWWSGLFLAKSKGFNLDEEIEAEMVRCLKKLKHNKARDDDSNVSELHTYVSMKESHGEYVK